MPAHEYQRQLTVPQPFETAAPRHGILFHTPDRAGADQADCRTSTAAWHSHEEPGQIIEALAAKDETRATGLMASHLQNVEDGLVFEPNTRAAAP